VPPEDERTPAERARLAMIESQLKPCGIVDPATVAAFWAVPREAFVAPGREALAYIDKPQPVGNGRALLAPLSLGHLIEAARPRAGERVLLVGAATGYSAAVLARFDVTLTALESEPALAARARALLPPGVAVVEGPLETGWPAHAPFGLILIEGAIEETPTDLVAQLAEGGRLATILVGEDGVARAALGRKQAGQLHFECFADVSGAVLPPFAKAPVFTF
jgi:protein-L-isoaspartate(D-aspartate) O-methyltransferase